MSRNHFELLLLLDVQRVKRVSASHKSLKYPADRWPGDPESSGDVALPVLDSSEVDERPIAKQDYFKSIRSGRNTPDLSDYDLWLHYHIRRWPLPSSKVAVG